MENKNEVLEREQKVIENAAKVTKRLEGDEVVIEIRVPAYLYWEKGEDWDANRGDGMEAI